MMTPGDAIRFVLDRILRPFGESSLFSEYAGGEPGFSDAEYDEALGELERLYEQLRYAGRLSRFVVWEAEDVKAVAADVFDLTLTDEEAYEILCQAVDKHNAEEGINWTVLESWIDEWLDRKESKEE